LRIELDNGYIEADEIIIGENVKFGKDIKINVRGKFQIGHDSYVGDRFTANAENITIGNFFYNGPTDSRGMVIGGGGSNFPFANLTIGDRVVCHTGHINLARAVTIGNDVGLSHDVDIITHGFWASVLDGYPNVFAEVNIGNNVIVGWKTVIMANVNICDNVVIGAHSTVVKDLTEERAIYAGSPAKLIKKVNEQTLDDQKTIINYILKDFAGLMGFYDTGWVIGYDEQNPFIVNINKLTINLKDLSYSGRHCDVTDAFRDFLRRYGIRVFVEGRPFKFNLKRKS
jgi:acetyltransferase-like isoleucine patch superfamily enzyme